MQDVNRDKDRSLTTVLLLILLATACVSIGESMLSAGMKSLHEGGIWMLIRCAVVNPYVLGGTALMMVYFGLYSYCLSIADISFVLPITALSYLFVALIARFALHEVVTPTRWLGAIIIVLGVVVVAFGEKR